MKKNRKIRNVQRSIGRIFDASDSYKEFTENIECYYYSSASKILNTSDFFKLVKLETGIKLL